ncbi:nitrate- and nitrite sensing domain-containing protein [Ningiella sp. W23]|uniref:nitrate- and nitrite sensing domain-containing protein n=1 Tax=Ningiella sp. W23 TaxID=3023715 RepID=UPI003757EC9A
MINATPSNTKRFLYAAKLAQLKTLSQLSSNCELVKLVCECIHQCQKERGVSNIYVASFGHHYTIRREKQTAQSDVALARLIALLDKHYIESQQNSDNQRLLFSISHALYHIDHLPNLRDAIKSHKVGTARLTESFCTLIESLISIIFEAADISNDPAVTQCLVSLFNFIQGKEYAGQERACGAIGFAKGSFDDKRCAKLKQLQLAQTRCFSTFVEYSDQHRHQQWLQLESSETSKEVNKLRSLIDALPREEKVASPISEVWYEITTKRIDKMHIIENDITSELVTLAQASVKDAEAELSAHKQDTEVLDSLHEHTSAHSALLAYPLSEYGLGKSDTASSAPISDQSSLHNLLVLQAKKIEQVSGELDATKQIFNEHKIINRAKLILIQQLSMSESQAHQRLQKSAMDKQISLYELALAIVKSTQVSKPIDLLD